MDIVGLYKNLTVFSLAQRGPSVLSLPASKV